MIQSKYYKFNINDFCSLHKNLNGTNSIYTNKTFNSSLTRIEKIYNNKIENLNLCFLNNINDLIKLLTEKNYSSNSIIGTLSCLSKICKMIDAPIITQNEFKNKIKELKENNNNIQVEQQLSIIREKQFIDYNIIQDKVKEQYTNYISDNISFSDFRRYLMLSLFTLQIPTRIQNYLNMIVKNINEEKINFDEYNNNNYFINNSNDKYYFIFNKYKTCKIYGQIILPIKNEMLINIINHWFNKFNKCNKFLITEDNKEITQKLFTKDLKEITKKLFNNNGFSVDILRSSFITYLYNTNPQYKIKHNISEIMGHNTTTSEIYYNKNKDNIDRDYMGLPIFN